MARILRAGSQIIRAGGGIAVPGGVAGLTLWLDFADAATLYQDTAGTSPVTADGQSIARAVSKIGAVALTQGTGAAQPTYKTGIQNGLSVGRWTTANYLDNTTFVAKLVERTAFFVCLKGAAESNAGLVTLKPATGNDYDRADAVPWTCGTGANAVLRVDNRDYLPTIDGTGWGVSCERKTAGVGRLYRNGGTPVVDSSFTEFAATSGGGILIGRRYIGGIYNNFYRFAGDVGEFLLYDRELTAADTNKVGAHLATKWGVTWSNIS